MMRHAGSIEVTPVPEGGIPDSVLIERLRVFYGEAQVAAILNEMEEEAAVRERGEYELAPVDTLKTAKIRNRRTSKNVEKAQNQDIGEKIAEISENSIVKFPEK